MWVAGVLEREGSFGLNRRTAGRTAAGKKLYIQLRVQCHMTDEDVILRLAEWTGMGHVEGPYQWTSGRKPYWRFAVNRKAEAEALMRELYPLLSMRRRAQIAEAFLAVSLDLPR
jgi:hypothetical protein